MTIPATAPADIPPSLLLSDAFEIVTAFVPLEIEESLLLAQFQLEEVAVQPPFEDLFHTSVVVVIPPSSESVYWKVILLWHSFHVRLVVDPSLHSI